MNATFTKVIDRFARSAGEALARQAARVANVGVPAQCLICEAIMANAGGCCAHCWQKIHFIAPPICPVTGKPFSHDMGEGMLSAEAIADPPPYRMCRSAVVYNETVRPLITHFKYADRTELAPWLASWMVAAGHEMLADNRTIVPVPLHRGRLMQRRFNQSAELGRAIARQSGLDYQPRWLRRIKKTRQQVGLSSRERQRNVQGSFRVPVEQKPAVNGASIVLIDDVYTSGATVSAATRALLRGGAADVCVLTLARVETLEV